MVCWYIQTYKHADILNTAAAAPPVSNDTTFIYVPLISDMFAMFSLGVTDDTYRLVQNQTDSLSIDG